MTVRLHLAITLLAIGTAACAGSPRPATTAFPVDRYGRYSFAERPAGTSVTFEGTFVVVADTVMVDATPGPCAYQTNSTRGGGFIYRCADITVVFDRDDPVQRAHYSFVAVTQKPKSVCVRYTTAPNGQQVCAQTGIEMTDVKTNYSGLLRPRRIEASTGQKP